MPSRRAQRRTAHAKPVVIAGEGVVAATVPGRTYEARPYAELPKKIPGQHRWIVLASWTVGDELARDAANPDVAKFLDNENLLSLMLGCWDCEQTSQECYGTPCPSEGLDDA